MSLTISEEGLVLTETIDGVTMPVDYSFKKVNDFVHSSGSHFEELQALCLGMASFIENRKALNEILQTMRDLCKYSDDTVWITNIETMFDRLTRVYVLSGGTMEELHDEFPEYVQLPSGDYGREVLV
jgi:hypothetical protein